MRICAVWSAAGAENCVACVSVLRAPNTFPRGAQYVHLSMLLFDGESHGSIHSCSFSRRNAVLKQTTRSTRVDPVHSQPCPALCARRAYGCEGAQRTSSSRSRPIVAQSTRRAASALLYCSPFTQNLQGLLSTPRSAALSHNRESRRESAPPPPSAAAAFTTALSRADAVCTPNLSRQPALAPAPVAIQTTT